MTRLGIMVWFVLVLGAGLTTFTVKYAVQNSEDRLNRVRKQTVAEQQEIRVLTAEWTYLNQPERLAELNQRFLGLVPITAKQLQLPIADIPLRAPAPAPAPDVVIAANPEPAAPSNPATATAAAPGANGPAAAAVVPAALARAEPSAAPDSLDALIAQAEMATNAVPAPSPRPSQAAAIAPVAYSPAPAAPLQLARAEPNTASNSLDALIARIAEAK